MQALLEGCAVPLIAIGCRAHLVEVTKRTLGTAQKNGLFLLRDLTKPTAVRDLFVTDEASLVRGVARDRIRLVTACIHVLQPCG